MRSLQESRELLQSQLRQLREELEEGRTVGTPTRFGTTLTQFDSQRRAEHLASLERSLEQLSEEEFARHHSTVEAMVLRALRQA